MSVRRHKKDDHLIANPLSHPKAGLKKHNVKYDRTDALSLWHLQKSTTMDIHGLLQTRGETRCPGD